MPVTSSALTSFESTLDRFGADLDSVRRFDVAAPDLLPYATLINARQSGDSDLSALLAVYEWQESPLVFLVDGTALRDDRHLQAIRRRLAFRGDAPYLGVVRPGQLVVYRVSLDGRTLAHSRVSVPDGEEGLVFPVLANNRPGLDESRRRWISDVVLKLLDESISELIGPNVSGDDAISLVGRALFTRFLGDRDLLPKSFLSELSAELAELFDTAERAEKTSNWLDVTFNGEFLPVRAGLFQDLPLKAFGILGNILRRAPKGQLYIEWREDWAHLDFSQIPVGVLSQSYELYLRKHMPDRQRKEGGFYTPSAIADLMVRGAFHAIRQDGAAHLAHILDPAAGAGVFLLSTFRQLVSERWRHDGVRPDTNILREILYEQITGFDINESALRFAALGLYLLSIELDPNPEPVEKLRFEDLRGSCVLQKVGDGQSLGSLGPDIDESHCGHYDLVIGNPPWASSTQLKDWSLVEQLVHNIAGARGVSQKPPPRLLPNQILDLPFVWRAMTWAKPSGHIAFALHARILFQRHDGMAEARRALFQAVDVTGVLNGTELRMSKVWPEITAPFCVVFARNRIPAPGAGFRFVSPHLEDSLNNAGGLRVDAANAEIISTQQVVECPELLKILFRGGILDLDIFERLKARDLITLRSFWQQAFGGTGRHLEDAGNGYQRLRPSSRIRKKGDGLPGVSASYLSHFSELTPEAMERVLINPKLLRGFKEERIHDKRPVSLFYGPLLLVHQSPPASEGRMRVAVADGDLVFNESYYGYSTRNHAEGRLLVRYLALILSSRLALWYILVTSGKFGFERDVVEKATVDDIPVPAFQALSEYDRAQITRLFDAVVQEDTESTWALVDAWVASLYGLRSADLQVIADTLRYSLPFAPNREVAQSRPDPVQLSEFRAALSAELTPWSQKFGTTLKVWDAPGSSLSPWRTIAISTGSHSERLADSLGSGEVLRIADQLAATEIVYPDPDNRCLWIARLAQARYWTKSQARLLARRIVWEHLDIFRTIKG
jgi:hypothetical protein